MAGEAVRKMSVTILLSLLATACAPVTGTTPVAASSPTPWKLSGMYRHPPPSSNADIGGNRKPLGPGCFGTQVGAEPWERRAAAATVHVIAIGGEFGQFYSAATGSVVRGSGFKGGPNRIVTAYHVTTMENHPRLSADPDPPKEDGGRIGSPVGTAQAPPPPWMIPGIGVSADTLKARPPEPGPTGRTSRDPSGRDESPQPGWVGRGTPVLPGPEWTPLGADEPAKPRVPARLAVVSSYGHPLGYARLVGGNPPAPHKASESMPPLEDLAVIEIYDWLKGGREEFDRIEGIDIAGTQASNMLTGEVSDPGGIEGGASGSAVLGTNGRLEGIVIAKSDVRNAGRLWAEQDRIVQAGDGAADMTETGPVPTSPVGIVRRTPTFVQPLTEFSVLHALNEAGRRVGVSSRRDEIEFVSNGFPLGACIVYRGTLSQMR